MLALLKMVTAFIGTVIFVKCFGIKGVMGVSAVAVAACLSSMSPGVYIALMNEKGDDFDCPSVLAVKILDAKKA